MCFRNTLCRGMPFQQFKLLRESFQYSFEMLAALHVLLVLYAAASASSYCVFTYAWVYLLLIVLWSFQSKCKFFTVIEWAKMLLLCFVLVFFVSAMQKLGQSNSRKFLPQSCIDFLFSNKKWWVIKHNLPWLLFFLVSFNSHL